MRSDTRRAYLLGLGTAVFLILVIMVGFVGVKMLVGLVSDNLVTTNSQKDFDQVMEEINKEIEKDQTNTANGSTAEDDSYGYEDKVEEILGLIESKYLDTYELEAIYESMYDGLVEALDDPYAAYFNVEELKAMMEDTAGSYEGIGAVISYTEDGEDIKVLAPYQDSPADQAGIIPDDVILLVDQVPISGMAIEEAVKLIKGDKGTKVILTIYRPSSDETMEITVTRDKIIAETVSYEMLDNNIGYLRLTGFQSVSPGQFREALKDLENQGQAGLIIDLRNNPGGLLSAVLEITDMLLSEGMIVYTEDKNGNREEYLSTDKESFDKPIVILVNQYSASASEILSGAIKDRDAGEIVGITTYGKGLVQNTYFLEDMSALKLTTQKYFTPSGAYITEVGIKPDVEVSLEGELPYLFDTEMADDIQLQKAIEVMEGLLQ